MMHYDENSEYEYLCWLIYCDRIERESAESDPLYAQHFAAYRQGDREESNRLWELATQRQSEIVEESRHREDIVSWLHLDSELRKENKTYPDVYERYSDGCC
ncbi:MAG TPA: hypothetical protein V6C57_16775 [Coleofasciculaceae cyanobacterium]